MGAALSNTALSRQLLNESRTSTDKPIQVKTEWNFDNFSKNEFAINRITALSDYYDSNIHLSSIGSDKCMIILHFYNKDEIELFKRQLKTTHPTIKVL